MRRATPGCACACPTTPAGCARSRSPGCTPRPRRAARSASRPPHHPAHPGCRGHGGRRDGGRLHGHHAHPAPDAPPMAGEGLIVVQVPGGREALADPAALAPVDFGLYRQRRGDHRIGPRLPDHPLPVGRHDPAGHRLLRADADGLPGAWLYLAARRRRAIPPDLRSMSRSTNSSRATCSFSAKLRSTSPTSPCMSATGR